MNISTDVLTILGDLSRGGTYILRIYVDVPLTVQFGRFLQGKPIRISPGNYLYVGSALSQRGSSSLARRLLRHATRTGERPFHPIRPALLDQFVQFRFANAPLRPPKQKKLHWHIDYLLDEAAANLTHIIVLRERRRLETAVSNLFTEDPGTTIIQPGLGARDAVGETHLLRVTAVSSWWHTLPKKLIPLLPQSE
ncbi:MAG: GIY-YIG nuclease family protein [Chloroflexi bacterium]|nr:GIY-YIG nuclease family protein [Chloroflexota bacterium]